MRTALACLLVALAGCAGQASPILAQPQLAPDPTFLEPGLHPFSLPAGGHAVQGLVAVPASGAGSALVVLAQGYLADAQGWAPLLRDLAGRGAVAVAVDYPGPRGGWNVAAGAADLLAATLAAQRAHPEARSTILVGASMGGEVSGLALAHAPPGTFTDWVAGAGVMDLADEWRAAASFQPAIEREAGGRPDQAAPAYSGLSPLDQVPAIAAAGLRHS